MIRSPLRYPGGKSILTNFFIDLFEQNHMNHVAYAEPYAGGAGAAINLLVTNVVSDIYINDANIGVYAFWKFIQESPQEFVHLVSTCPVTLDEWKKQREIVEHPNQYDLKHLGFATFYMSRTNRSGVLTAGPIGGNSIEKQRVATYKLDCRFNKEALIQRLQMISAYAHRIHVSNMDALDFLKSLDPSVFVYLDPPYYVKGKCLYMNHYSPAEHEILAKYLLEEIKNRWVLSYDDVPNVRELYKSQPMYRFPLSYSVHNIKIGYELLTHSKDLTFPEALTIRRGRHNNIQINKI